MNLRLVTKLLIASVVATPVLFFVCVYLMGDRNVRDVILPIIYLELFLTSLSLILFVILLMRKNFKSALALFVVSLLSTGSIFIFLINDAFNGPN